MPWSWKAINDSYKLLNTFNLQDYLHEWLHTQYSAFSKFALIKIQIMFISAAIIAVFHICKQETEGLQESGLDVYKNGSKNPTPLCTSA